MDERPTDGRVETMTTSVQTITNFPRPGKNALALSRTLSERIRTRIEAAGGAIAFDEYMAAALYEPGFGYYVNGAVVFGADGDYVTAPEISPLFGACVARQCAEVMADAGHTILEFGGGSGRLAASVLEELEGLGCVPQRYLILELSPELRQRQRDFLAAAVPRLAHIVTWLGAPPDEPVQGVVIANEILDALPVKVFRLAGPAVHERQVRWQHHGPTWHEVPADAALASRIAETVGAEVAAGGTDYVSELNPRLGLWIGDLGRILSRGLALVLDYGYPRHEYYHPGRSAGTLLCHFRHCAHGDPFLYPGLQDITAAVDFTALAEAADASGLCVAGFATQANFLLSCGLPEMLERHAQGGPAARFNLAQGVKVLTLPSEMGERCKVMALARDYDRPLTGFALRDERYRLAGPAG